MDISRESKSKLVSILNTEARNMPDIMVRANLAELQEIAREYKSVTEANNGLLASHPTTKVNSSLGSDFPTLPKDADLETVTRYWFALYKWLAANGGGGLTFLYRNLQTMFPQYMQEGAFGADNPRGRDGYLSQPKHDGTGAYANTEKQNALAMPRDKVLSFNQRTGKMELR